MVQLKLNKQRIKEALAKVDSLFPSSDETLSPSDRMWGSVCQTAHSDMKNIYLVFSKIVRYFLKKEENTNRGVIVEDEEENPDITQINNPIFETLKEPSQYEVGNLINLNCGHAMRPSDHEANLIH